MVSNRIAAFVFGLLPNMHQWKLLDDLSQRQKSMIIVAPHTSYWDAIIGKYIFAKAGVNHRFLSKSELFRWPFNYLMRFFGSIPVGGIKGHNSINDVAREFDRHDSIHIIICPEGQLAKTTKWNPGFIYMAQKAQVPIVVLGLDYKRKEVFVIDVLEDVSNAKSIMQRLPEWYKGIHGRHPEHFALHEVR